MKRYVIRCKRHSLLWSYYTLENDGFNFTTQIENAHFFDCPRCTRKIMNELKNGFLTNRNLAYEVLEV